MNRIDKACCSDCAQCQLLANGEVDMVHCVLDQVFRRLQKIEKIISSKASKLASDVVEQ